MSRCVNLDPDRITDVNESPERSYADIELRKVLKKYGFQRFEREVVISRAVYKMSYPDIAYEYGYVDAPTVRRIYMGVKEKIRSVLDEDLWGED